MTPEEAFAELARDPAYISQLSWSFLLGMAAVEFHTRGVTDSAIHSMAETALRTRMPDEQEVPPWVFLLALAATWLQKMGLEEIVHQAIDVNLEQARQVEKAQI